MTPLDVVEIIQQFIDSMYNKVRSLQKRKRKCNVADIFSTMIASSFGDNNENNFKNLSHDNKYLADSSRSYWRNKIYDLDFTFNFHAFAVNNELYITDSSIDIHFNIFDNFNVYAGDGIKLKTGFNNLQRNGKNIASIVAVPLYDIKYGVFRDYKISYKCNEHEALLQHDLKKKDLIILDRLYSSTALFNNLRTRCKFLVRLKSNLTCYKNFTKDVNINTKIVVVNGVRIRLVKYYVDEDIRKIIIDKYAEDALVDNNPANIKLAENENKSICMILATNVTTLNIDECIYLYKKRWKIEIAFKQLKQHFRVRYVNKQSNTLLPLRKCEFWYRLSFLMFNMTHVLKNSIDIHQYEESNYLEDDNYYDECKYSECVIYIRDLISGRLKKDNIINDVMHLQKQKVRISKTKKVVFRDIKRGTYKSVTTVIDLNKEYYDKKKVENDHG